MRPYYVKLQNDSTYRRCLSSETAALAFAAALGPDAYIEPVPTPAGADIPRRDYGAPLERLRHHVTGAIERGERTPVVELKV